MIQTFEDAFTTMTYPAGEPHVRLTGLHDDTLFIIANIRDFNGLLTAVTANRILRHQQRYVWWVIPYFPFARHDRRIDINDGEELHLAMEVAAELNPIVVDPHSDVTARFKHFTQQQVVAEFANHGLFDRANTIVAIPDAGAAKKAYSWLGSWPYVTCSKRRDQQTGRLSGFTVGEPERVKGKHVVIVDDICDAGGTFLGLAEGLRSAGATGLSLAVTHGLFTKGLTALTDVYDRIYTLDTCPLNDPQLVRVPLAHILNSGRYQ